MGLTSRRRWSCASLVAVADQTEAQQQEQACDDRHRGAAHNCDALPSKHTGLPVTSSGRDMIMPSRLAGSIPIIATLVLTALGVGAPTSTARAEDCLASPNSPAPNGSWWYYRLDWPTQRKCWYLRALGRSAQQTAERATTGYGQPARAGSALFESTRPSDSADDSTSSLPAADTAPVGSIVQEVPATQASTRGETNVPTAPPTQNDAPVTSATIQQSADEGKAATHFQSDPFRKQARRHKLTPKRQQSTQLTSMQYPESRHTQYRLTTPPLQCPTTT